MPREIIDLIHRMSLANRGWGAPRIHRELLKLGFQLSQATVAKYMVRSRKPPSQTWRTFLENHTKDLVATDFFVVRTVLFRVLFVFVILSHDRRRTVHFGVTAHPSSEWAAHHRYERVVAYRNPKLIAHPVEELVAQRVYGLALGYEDLNEIASAARNAGEFQRDDGARKI